MALLAFIGFLALQTAGLRRVTLKTDFSESADQGIGKRQIAFPVILSPALLIRDDALVQQEAVQHQPGAPVDEDQLRRAWIAAEMLDEELSGSG